MSGMNVHVSSFAGRDEAEQYYIREVDRLAEAKRAAIITAAPGQSMTYEAKYQEAVRHPSGTSFPFLSAEAQALEVPVSEVAASVLEARAQWETAGAQIEGARLKAKKAVRNAGTTAGMQAVATDLSLALNQL